MTLLRIGLALIFCGILILFYSLSRYSLHRYLDVKHHIIRAKSANALDIQEAIDRCPIGWTVMIPAGIAVWETEITYGKQPDRDRLEG
jgi:hypothetical protein